MFKTPEQSQRKAEIKLYAKWATRHINEAKFAIEAGDANRAKTNYRRAVEELNSAIAALIKEN